jgi:hypothetical protein
MMKKVLWIEIDNTDAIEEARRMKRNCLGLQVTVEGISCPVDRYDIVDGE